MAPKEGGGVWRPETLKVKRGVWGRAATDRLARPSGPSNLSLILYVLRLVTKNTRSAHEWDLELVSGADLGIICTIFGAGAVPVLPGARRGHQLTENWPQTRGRIYHVTLGFIIHDFGGRGGKRGFWGGGGAGGPGHQ